MLLASDRPKRGPQFVQYFGPVLNALRELGGSARPAEVSAKVAEDLAIPESVQEELLESGSPRYEKRIAWARFYLARTGFIDSSQRGVWTLTDKGRGANLTSAQAYDIFRTVQGELEGSRRHKAGSEDTEEGPLPDEKTGSSTDHRVQLMNIVQTLPPDGFERFCQRLLRESGFQEVTVTGRSGDGGIDGIGILRVNALVSFKVLFQCKRYQGTVAATHVRDFRGAMQGRTDKGIIITTGTFPSDAKREAVRDGVPPIELVDGEALIGMLEELELGLKPIRTYEIDRDFFDDFGAITR